MRRFRDAEGNEWDVTLGRESWGAFYAIFVEVGGPGLRQALLEAVSELEANQTLHDLPDDEVGVLFRASEAKEG